MGPDGVATLRVPASHGANLDLWGRAAAVATMGTQCWGTESNMAAVGSPERVWMKVMGKVWEVQSLEEQYQLSCPSSTCKFNLL